MQLSKHITNTFCIHGCQHNNETNVPTKKWVPKIRDLEATKQVTKFKVMPLGRSEFNQMRCIMCVS
jgi:hypothetical protein